MGRDEANRNCFIAIITYTRPITTTMTTKTTTTTTAATAATAAKQHLFFWSIFRLRSTSSPAQNRCIRWIYCPSIFPSAHSFFFHFAVLLFTEAIRTLCVRISAFYISAWIFCSPVTFVYQPNDHLCTFSIFLMRFFTSFFSPFYSAVVLLIPCAHSIFFPFVFSLLLFYLFAYFPFFFLHFSSVVALCNVKSHQWWPAHRQPHSAFHHVQIHAIHESKYVFCHSVGRSVGWSMCRTKWFSQNDCGASVRIR